MKKYRKHNDYPDLYRGKQVCCTCAHFVQHYRSQEVRAFFAAVGYGHCVFPRLKIRAPDQHCENWKPIAKREPASKN